jgi:hypothetical protein
MARITGIKRVEAGYPVHREGSPFRYREEMNGAD